MGWANRVTILRAGLTVVLWALLARWAPSATPTQWWIAIVLFSVTAVTDVLDGFLARRLQEVSVFGRIADPLVDKLLVLGTMVMLLAFGDLRAVLPAWAVTLMLAREFVVTALRGAVEGRGVSFQALPFGKVKMWIQSIAVGFVMGCGAGVPIAHAPWWAGGPNLALVTVLLATLVTVVSGIDYAVRATRLLRD
ncbi:MAG: CDP-alcohol phosphatidyltransferase family protein [Planctomycetota bacterium]